MKKFLTFALCLATLGSMSAQKATVDQAKKLAGKLDKLEEARSLINQAIQNPETANDVYTYSTAGKIEYDAYNTNLGKLQINKEDPTVDQAEMGKQLLNGYNFYKKAFTLDSLPNEKGQIKPKYSKEMASVITGHHDSYFSSAGNAFNSKRYPEAYELFMIFGEIPENSWYPTRAETDSVVASAYYWAGLAANYMNEYRKAVDAFEMARKHHIKDDTSYQNEIAIWKMMIQKDSTLSNEGTKKVYEIALEGYNNFGIKNPVFLQTLSYALLNDNKFDEAMNLVNKEIQNNPDISYLYILRGTLLDNQGEQDASIADYIKGASMPDADVETLNLVARKLYVYGNHKWNNLEDYDPSQKQDIINEIKTQYWGKAKSFLQKSLELQPNNPDAERILESVEYNLSLS